MSFGDSEDTNLLHNKNVRIPKPASHKPSDEQTQDRGDSTITCVGSTCTLLKTSREPRIVHLEKEHHYKPYTPEMYCNMEPKNGGLEADFPFQFRWFLGSMLIFRGVNLGVPMEVPCSFSALCMILFWKKIFARNKIGRFFLVSGWVSFPGHIYLSKNALFYPSKDPPAIKHLHPGRLTWNPFRKENDLPNLQEYVPC